MEVGKSSEALLPTGWQGAQIRPKMQCDEDPMFSKKDRIAAASLPERLTVAVSMLTESFRNLGGSRKIARWGSHLKVGALEVYANFTRLLR